VEQSRQLLAFFDERGLGKVSVNEVSAIIQDLINQQIGGGVYAFMQVQPVIQRIIKQLAVDADDFFDQLALQNESLLEERLERNDQPSDARKPVTRDELCGLNKRLFFAKLEEFGVALPE
jgi:hypothetical protein